LFLPGLTSWQIAHLRNTFLPAVASPAAWAMLAGPVMIAMARAIKPEMNNLLCMLYAPHILRRHGGRDVNGHLALFLIWYHFQHGMAMDLHFKCIAVEVFL
jgi:hypothetical protein